MASLKRRRACNRSLVMAQQANLNIFGMPTAHQLWVAKTTLFIVRRGAVLAGYALIAHVAETGAGPSVTVSVLLTQTVVHPIVHRSNHPRAYFCISGGVGGCKRHFAHCSTSM